MRFLKILLYLILTFCIAWGVLIFSGPKLIETFLRYHYGNNIKISGLRVSPDLAVNASRLDFYELPIEKGFVLNGYVRSISLDWGGLLESSPYFKISTGLSSLEGFGGLKNGVGVLSFSSLGDFSSAKLTLNLEGLDLSERGSFEALEVNSNFYPYQNKFSDVVFAGEKLLIHSKPLAHSERIKGKIDSIDFRKELTDAHLKFDATLEQLKVPDVGFRSGKMSISSIGKGLSDLRVSFAEVNIDNWFKIKDIKIDADSKNALDNFDLIFSINEVDLVQGNSLSTLGRIENIMGTAILTEAQNLEISTKGHVGQIEIVNGNQFVAGLSDKGLEFDVSVSLKNQVIADLSMRLDTVPMILFSVTAKFNQPQPVSFNCSLLFCGVNLAGLEYEIKTLNAALSGLSDCSSEACDFRYMKHTLQTDNTEIFFSDILGMQVFNPLIIAALYGQLKSGIKLGDGHQFNF